MSAHTLYKDGYQRVDTNGDYIYPEISLGYANDLRQYVLYDFIDHPSARINNLAISDSKEHPGLSYTAFYGAKTFGTPDCNSLQDKSIFAGALLRQYDDDTWKLHIVHNRMQSQNNDYNEQRLKTNYLIFCIGSQLVEATRTVKYVRSKSANYEDLDGLLQPGPLGCLNIRELDLLSPCLS